MRIEFLDGATLGEDLDYSELEGLGEFHHHRVFDQDRMADKLKEAEILISNRLVYRKELLEQLPRLQLICLTATGYNNVDLDAARELGIAVCNVRDYSTESVAQHTFTLLLGLLGQVEFYDRFVKEERFRDLPLFTSISRTWFELKGQNWGIIGMGNIGRRVAELASAFGCHVRYSSISGSSRQEAWPEIPLEELLRTSRILSIHAPLTDKTRDLLQYEDFCTMSPDSVVLNLGRGPIVSESGLARALEEGKIAGAALDVFRKEPLEEGNPLLNLNCPDKVLLSPHIAWGSRNSRTQLLSEIAENIRAFERGEKRNRLETP